VAAGVVSEDVAAFLREHTRTFLFTLRRDGSPTVHPMTGIYRDGALYMNTYRKSVKARNLMRDERVCCLVTSGENEAEERTVLIEGKAEVLPVGSTFPGLARRPESGAGGIRGVSAGMSARTQERLNTGKRIVVRVVPERARFL
jgi:hypothetical protein